jgi:hypothetical protein
MPRVFLLFAITGVVSSVALAGAGPRTRVRAVSVKVSHETAPAGGLAQLKIRMTDDKPIITGRARLSLVGLAGVEGISLVSPSDDAAGLAVVRGTDIALTVVSPNGTFGMDSDYPLITVAGRVPADAIIGETFPVVLHPDALQLIAPTGVSYPTDISQGQLMSWPGLAIYDVVPGSATVTARGTVSILGSHFHPATEVRFGETEAAVAHVHYVGPTRLDVTVRDTTSMHGIEIEARTPDDSRVTYFSYQRTSRWGKSAHAVLRDVVPLFLRRTMREATLQLDGATAGVALQNLDTQDATVMLDLLASDGVLVDVARMTIPTNQFVVRDLREVFHARPAGAVTVRLSSTTPVQVLGVSVDASGAATPRLPQ